MTRYARAGSVLALALTMGAGGMGPVSAETTACAEDLSAILGVGLTRVISPGVDLTVWNGQRAGASDQQRAVRAAVVHSSGGFAALQPILALPGRTDPELLVERSGAVAAVNGDLFATLAFDAAVPSGPVVQEGSVRYAPPGRHRVVHWSDGRPRVHRARLRASVVIRTVDGDVRIPVVGVNYPSLVSGAVLFTHPWSGRTVRGQVTLVIRGGRLVDVIRGGSRMALQRGVSIVQVSGEAQVPSGVRIGDRVEVRAVLERTRADANALGHGGRLLRDGAVTRECSLPGSLLRPRTAFAWNDAGEAWLAVVSNGLEDPRDGMRIGGAAATAVGAWLAGLGATDAVLLDGGGSTIMLRPGRSGVLRVDLPASTYRRPVPVLLGVVGVDPPQAGPR